MPLIDEVEKRGNIALVKVDAETGQRVAQGDAHLAGARYDIVNRSGSAVVSPQTGEEVDVGLAVNNSLGLAADGMALAVEYDPAALTPVAAVPAGLGATLALSSETDAANGTWTIRATGGEVAAGLGAAGARRPPCYIRGEIRRVQRHALGHSVHHHSDSLSV